MATQSIYKFLLLLSLFNLPLNASLIPSPCRYPNSELCQTLQQRNQLDRFSNNRHFNVNDEFDKEVAKLPNLLEALVRRSANENLVRCINLGDDSCNNGSLPGSGKDDDFLIGGGNPGKRSRAYGIEPRCLNLGDDGCWNGVLPGSGKDDEFLSGSGNPGKRSY